MASYTFEIKTGELLELGWLTSPCNVYLTGMGGEAIFFTARGGERQGKKSTGRGGAGNPPFPTMRGGAGKG